jgi:K+/H+ antiporter YhaU regulatory subunit KhtT
MPDQPRSSGANSYRNRVRYRFDNLLARGTWVVLLWLGVVTLIAVLLAALVLAASGVALAGSENSSFVEEFWQSLMRTMDPGTMADDVGWGRRVVALAVTTVGILIAGTLIGLIANGIEQRMTLMQRGRSVVVESGHTVVLGASDRLPIVVEQLVFANIGRRKSAIVVLSEREPVELSEAVRGVVSDTKGTRLVFRWGDPTRPTALSTVAITKARNVIVLADEGARGDAGVVKTVLAAGIAMGGFGSRPIVAELIDPKTAETLVRACGESVHPVVAVRSVARTALFAMREPGLNQVIEEIVDYRGADIYVLNVPDLVGRSFGELVVRSATTCPIGRIRSTGEVEFNTPAQTLIEKGDRLIVIADDGEHLDVGTDGSPEGAAPYRVDPIPLDIEPREEHFLILGWNALGAHLVEESRSSTTPESTIQVVYDPRVFEPEELQDAEDDITWTPARRDLWRLSDVSRTREFTTIVILGYRRGMSVEEADSRTLLNLMLVRRDLESWDRPAPRVLVELLDADNVPLARMTGADDYLVSDTIGSRAVVQLAEEPERGAIFFSLYDGDGPSVHLIPAERIGLNGTVDGAEVAAAALAAGLVAIGWRRAIERGGEVILNPHFDDQITLEDGDQIVVIG